MDLNSDLGNQDPGTSFLCVLLFEGGHPSLRRGYMYGELWVILCTLGVKAGTG